MSEIDYDKLADAVAKRLSLLPPPEKIIWSAKRCAEHLDVTEKHFVDKLSKCYGFPPAIKFPSITGIRGQKRWYQNDIIEWVGDRKEAG